MQRLGLIVALSLLLLAALALPAAAQAPPGPGSSAWIDVVAGSLVIAAGAAVQAGDPLPQHYRLLALDRTVLSATLAAAPAEGDLQAAAVPPLLLALPLPHGEMQLFAVEQSPVMEPVLAAQYPDVQTYRGVGLDDPSASARLGLTSSGFHAVILSEGGTVFITPAAGADASGNLLYMSYFAADMAPPADFFCGVHDGMHPSASGEEALRAELSSLAPAVSAGSELRTYRLALAATGEFAEEAAMRAGLTNPNAQQLKTAALNALATRVNMVNAIYEREVSIRFTLVNGNDALVYVNSTSDPYTDSDMGAMLGQNQDAVDALIGSANYDVGHVLGTAGGGVAYLGVACYSYLKAGGVSGSGAGASAYTTMVTAHELGHQFNADHTFNAASGACGGGNRSADSAYEPGSGSTIMSYSGLCGAAQDLPAYNTLFHVISFEQLVTYSRAGDGASCGSSSVTGNQPPSVNAGSDYFIPARTPFLLTGTSTDPEGSTLHYSWQQVDLPAANSAGSATLNDAMTDKGNGPLYRVYPFAAGGNSRAFPTLTHVLAGTTALGEVYPTTTRTLNFRLIARDNQGTGSGVDYDTVRLSVVNTGAAFAVTLPNSATIWPGGLARTVTWNVAGTDEAPIFCTSVDILFSGDNGATSVVLAQGTSNDGAQTVTLPSIATAVARIEVRCAGNIFYNVSPPFAVFIPSSWGTVAGTVRDETGAAIAGANVTASGLETVTMASGTGGEYSVQLLSGDYSVRVAAYGYTATTAAIAIGNGITLTRDVVLAALPPRTVSGNVRDSGHGYPLYATLVFTDVVSNRQVARAWTDPLTGNYSATLRAGLAYTLGVTAWLPGYAAVQQPLSAGLAPVELEAAAIAADFVLPPAANCVAPGYTLAGSQCTPVAGGLLVGSTYGPDSAALAGIRIAGGGRTITSTVTADGAVPDGFYSLFLPPGAQPITATGEYNGSALPVLRATVPISSSAVTQQDLNWQPLYIDASLSNLAFSNWPLTPLFAPDVLTYTLAVPGNLGSITFLPVTTVSGAAVRVNGMSVVSGIPSPPINLAVGENLITVAVTALDGVNTRTYWVTVTRAELVEHPVYMPDIRNRQ